MSPYMVWVCDWVMNCSLWLNSPPSSQSFITLHFVLGSKSSPHAPHTDDALKHTHNRRSNIDFGPGCGLKSFYITLYNVWGFIFQHSFIIVSKKYCSIFVIFRTNLRLLGTSHDESFLLLLYLYLSYV